MNSQGDAEPDHKRSSTLQIQSVLFKLPSESVSRALDYLGAAVRTARAQGIVAEVTVAYGDCSPEPVLDHEELAKLRARHAADMGIAYTFFGANLGSAEGHNRLLRASLSDLTLIVNPDVLASPSLLTELSNALRAPNAGLAEARQMPIDHPKDYDKVTGETSWGSTACLLGSTETFQQVNGFDSDTFFLYCDDVDFSWRVRLSGKTVIHCPNAVVFHDKRLSQAGGWISSAAERYYSAEAALLLSYKFSREDITGQILAQFRASGNDDLLKAAALFDAKAASGRLPAQIDARHAVGDFIDGHYGHHRFNAS